MYVEVVYTIPNTTVQGTAIIPVDDRSSNVYVLKSRFDEAIHHLEVMVYLNKQLQQRIDQIESR